MNIVLLAQIQSTQGTQGTHSTESHKISKTTESAIKTERTRVTESRLSQITCPFQITPFYTQSRFKNFDVQSAIFTRIGLISPETNQTTLNSSPENHDKLAVNDTAIIKSFTQVKHVQQVLGLKVGDSIKVGVLYGKIGTAIISEIKTFNKTTVSDLNMTALDSQSSSLERVENKAVKNKVVDAFDVLNELKMVDYSPLNKSNSKSNSKSINKALPINHQPVKQQIVLSNIKLVSVPPPKLDLTVVLALPRPKVLRRLIMDMTAIGVREIILVNNYRTDKSYWQSPILQRLDEFVVEGLQQGVDTVPPSISFKKRLKPFVEDELSLLTQKQLAVVAHPYAGITLNQFVEQQTLPQLICIGAEGGWIDYEVDMLTNNGCTAISFGSRILRTEAIVNALCGRYI